MIKVGTIINTHGLKGECKIYLTTDDVADRFKKGRKLYLDDSTILTVLSFRMQKGFGYCRFEEITDIDQAKTYKTKNLFTRKEDLPQLEDGSYYYHQLMGCSVLDEGGQDCGTVVDILETGAHIVLRVQDSKTSFLLPFVGAFIKDVDVQNKKILFHDMEGLR